MSRHSRPGLPAPFVVGDSVLVHRTAFRKHRDLHELKKFDVRWLGPFAIIKVVNANAYQLQLPSNFKKHNTINITFLHPYRQSQRFPRPHPNSLRPAAESYATSDDDDDGEYEVEVYSQSSHYIVPTSSVLVTYDCYPTTSDYEESI